REKTGLPADFGKPRGMGTEPATVPPWGEFVTYDIELEQPQEYVAFEATADRTPHWIFEQRKPPQVGQLMASCGLTAEQITRALSPQMAEATSSNTVITPDAGLILSLSPTARGKLYTELAQ